MHKVNDRKNSRNGMFNRIRLNAAFVGNFYKLNLEVDLKSHAREARSFA